MLQQSSSSCKSYCTASNEIKGFTKLRYLYKKTETLLPCPHSQMPVPGPQSSTYSEPSSAQLCSAISCIVNFILKVCPLHLHYTSSNHILVTMASRSWLLLGILLICITSTSPIRRIGSGHLSMALLNTKYFEQLQSKILRTSLPSH